MGLLSGIDKHSTFHNAGLIADFAWVLFPILGVILLMLLSCYEGIMYKKQSAQEHIK